MNDKKVNGITIIGGADGPTSVFVAGKLDKKPLKIKIRERMYRYRRSRAERKITANAHTLEEVVSYAKDKYGIVEMDEARIEYQEKYGKIPDNKMTMDFHMYKICMEQGTLTMEMDYAWKDFGISYSGSKKEMKRFKKITQDLYLYYGVEETDIRNRTERYLSLLVALS